MTERINYNISNLSLTNNSITTSNLVLSNISASNLILSNTKAINVSTSNLNSTNVSISNLNSTNIYSSNITSSNSYLSNIISINHTTTNLLSTNASCSNIQINNLTSSNAKISSISSSNIISSNISSSNITSSSIISSNISSTYLSSGSLNSLYSTISNLNISGSGITTSNIVVSSGSLYLPYSSSAILVDSYSNWPSGTHNLISIKSQNGNDTVTLYTPGSQSSTPKMTLQANGNIGIGTTSPSRTVDIQGNFRILNSGTNSFTFGDGSLTTLDISPGYQNNSTQVDGWTTFNINGNTNGNNGLYISNNLIVASNVTCSNIFTNSLISSFMTTNSLISLNITSTNINSTTATVGTLLSTLVSSASIGASGISASNIYSTAISASTLNLSTGITTANINFIGNLYQNGIPYISSQWTTTNGNLFYTGGNIGIYTTSPTSALDVSGHSRITGTISSGSLVTTNITTSNIVSGAGILGPFIIIQQGYIDTTTGSYTGYTASNSILFYERGNPGVNSSIGFSNGFGQVSNASSESITWNKARFVMRGSSLNTDTVASTIVLQPYAINSETGTMYTQSSFSVSDNGSRRGYTTWISPWFNTNIVSDIQSLGIKVLSLNGVTGGNVRIGTTYLQFSY